MWNIHHRRTNADDKIYSSVVMNGTNTQYGVYKFTSMYLMASDHKIRMNIVAVWISVISIGAYECAGNWIGESKQQTQILKRSIAKGN